MSGIKPVRPPGGGWDREDPSTGRGRWDTWTQQQRQHRHQQGRWHGSL